MPAASTVVAVAAVAAAVAAAGTAAAQGVAANKTAKKNAKAADQFAQRERQKAAIEAADLRRRADRQQARQRALRAGSGILAGTGSSLLLEQDLEAEEEFQALTILDAGGVGALRLNTDADRLRTSGRNARTSGFIKAGTTLLTGASKLGGLSANAPVESAAPFGGSL